MPMPRSFQRIYDGVWGRRHAVQARQGQLLPARSFCQGGAVQRERVQTSWMAPSAPALASKSQKASNSAKSASISAGVAPPLPGKAPPLPGAPQSDWPA